MQRSIRFPLRRLSLPLCHSDVHVHYLDYSPFNSISLGYIRETSSAQSGRPADDLRLAELPFSSFTSYSFDDKDAYFILGVSDEETVRSVWERGRNAELLTAYSGGAALGTSNSGSSSALNNKIFVHFTDVYAGSEFRERFMSDVSVAFTNMRHISSKSVSFVREDDDESETQPESPVKDGKMSAVGSTRTVRPSQDGTSELESETGVETNRNRVRIKCDDAEEVEGDAGSSQPERRPFPTDPGLYIPTELFACLNGNSLAPLAKIQTLGSRNLLFSIRNELMARGANGGFQRLNIAKELSNAGYWREVKQLWESFEGKGRPDFDFAFERLISFLQWTEANLDFVSDYGLLSVEMLMICRNGRWHETTAARKRFDVFFRELLLRAEELRAVRNWCGVLREKTVLDLATARAHQLSVLDLGTMVVKAPFDKWNLKRLFRELSNLTDLTWLNCDLRALMELRSVEHLKRLVLHITKFESVFYRQFFARFGWKGGEFEEDQGDSRLDNNMYDDDYDSDEDFIDDRSTDSLSQERETSRDGSSELSQSDQTTSQQTSSSQGSESQMGRWLSASTPAANVQLDYAVLSFASCFHARSNSKSRENTAPLVFTRGFKVPTAIVMANSIGLNVPCQFLEDVLDVVSTRELQMFSVGMPSELCTNIRPNRIPFPDVVRILESMSYNVNRNWKHKHILFHVMVDFYVPQRVAHLLNLVVLAFPAAERIRLHFETARKSDKSLYRGRRTPYMFSSHPVNLRVFELYIDSLTFRLPMDELASIGCATLEEFHMTITGIPRDYNHRIKADITDLLGRLMDASSNPHINTIVFKLNASFLFALFEKFAESDTMRVRNTSLHTLGFVCKGDSQRRGIKTYHRIESAHYATEGRLRRLILDPRDWGDLTKGQLSQLHDLMPECEFIAELAPDDYRYIDERPNCDGYAGDSTDDDDFSYSPSDSPRLDEGVDDVLLCSDYSNSGLGDGGDDEEGRRDEFEEEEEESSIETAKDNEDAVDESFDFEKPKKKTIRRKKKSSESSTRSRKFRSKRAPRPVLETESDSDLPGPSGVSCRLPQKDSGITLRSGRKVEKGSSASDSDYRAGPSTRRGGRRNAYFEESEESEEHCSPIPKKKRKVTVLSSPKSAEDDTCERKATRRQTSPKKNAKGRVFIDDEDVSSGPSDEKDDSWDEETDRKRTSPRKRASRRNEKKQTAGTRRMALRSDDAKKTRRRMFSSESEEKSVTRDKGSESDSSQDADEWTPPQRRSTRLSSRRR